MPNSSTTITPHLSTTSWVILLFVLLVSYATFQKRTSGSIGKKDDNDTHAIIVLGGGLNVDGTPPLWMEARCKLAKHQYNIIKQIQTKPPVIVTLSGGTTWKPPPKDKNGFPITEASSSAQYLAKLGVPSSDLYEEAFSLDTIGNAYFLRLTHTDPAQWHSLVIITNKFHMPRTKAIFEWVFQLPTIRGTHQPLPYKLQFEEAEDAGMTQQVLQGRMDKEAASLLKLPQTSSKVKSLQELHQFLFRDHSAYSTSRYDNKEQVVIDPAVLSTY